ncbi:MAG: SIMPL domain-containing protein [Mitsuokella jalaludinii]|uniref:26 kDa periplasmic immunogenic protein n=1 Tax=Mitsuokella jalaludinii TaxID=187979 RepID=A0A174AHL4_9FIRM|nr:SIMPL domain-containing protein [Mitsuokella jalaludinii]MCI6607780.1 SIMPL domain-containing protein [Mitsuokella jalaludinii]MCI6611071.1 SIMPL domain-containing protein [Mitsuokella jalaludinii]MCI7063876.1 SIMPL domain-containing protein [Mitsuokella jalaludinii]MCI7186411.1 SIMPL domain-containing protein [Mitsuokella jalaludinii]MCI7716310.1 SIMPL domain-containing protein [Mitsuokella jalaludinii]
MKKTVHILTLVCALFLMSCSAAFAAPQQETPRPTLSVDGQGTGTAAPDMATVTIGVTTQGKDAAKAQNDNAWVSNQIQAAVRGLGIAEKDIQTRNYSFYPNYSTDKDRRNEVTGYTVNNSVIVVVRDIKLTGKVIDAALNNGANEINSLDFSASDTKAVRKVALLNAVQDARDKADIIAKGLGKRIVGIQNVSESTGYIETRRFGGNMLMAVAKDAATPIAPGSLSLTANVHIDFILSD